MIKILHNKLPISENGYCLISIDNQQRIHNHLQTVVKQLDEPYIVISTPTELTCINDKDVILRIDAKEYTYEELKEVFEKARKYDELN